MPKYSIKIRKSHEMRVLFDFKLLPGWLVAGDINRDCIPVESDGAVYDLQWRKNYKDPKMSMV